MARTSVMATVLQKHQQQLLSEWVRHLQGAAADGKKVRISPQELNAQAGEFLQLLTALFASGSADERTGQQFKALAQFLEGVSRSRVQQGFSSVETATFIFSFKQPLFEVLRSETGSDAKLLADEIWTATKLLDELGLITVNAYQRAREEVINRQQQEMLELSTPVVKLWEGILALPMIGTLDSARTQIVMESLLHRIVETGSQLAIIDITGVPTVDTLVAQHLLKTVTAIRLMGADCIISGVRPQIAQTIVHLGVDLQGVTTKANLADALSLALKLTGNTMSR
ncbi:MAG TPA: STAS domain-containing protein [Steroidobacteraceae bacterium]|nr:STAS domain-containing protein [Steroidobacteraceae bacterium]